MMAALQAAERGRHVVLLEKMEQPGRKLRITGKGRCNLTNTAPLKEFLTHVGSEPRFMRNSCAQFFNTDLMDFFEQHGVPLVVERGNRVFPQSGKSLDIFLALVEALEKSPQVEIHKNATVASLIIEDGATEAPHVAGVRLQNGMVLRASHVLLTTGGKSYPSTGSTGDGYALAEQAGHTVVSPVPALVPLLTDIEIPRETVNFALRNVRLTMTLESGKKLSEHFGEMYFTEDGIGGPIVLSVSRYVTRPLHDGTHIMAHLDLKPAIDVNTLDHRLQNDFDQNGTRLFHDALRLWMPAEFIPLALRQLHIEYYKRLNQINGAERKRLLRFLKDFTFPVTATAGFDEAVVTQGGVALNEVDPKTMESKKMPGLFIAGELLDLDADTGGYNLQLAFTTAVAAGRHV